MKRSKGHTPALAALLLASVAGLALRAAQLAIVFDADGLPTTGHPLTWVLSIYCVVAVLFMGAFCLRLPARRSAQAVLRAGTVPTAASMVGGVLLLVASLLSAGESLLTLSTSTQQMNNALELLLGVLGAVSGLCILAAASARQKGSKASSGLYLLPFVFALCQLVLDFKNWSSDPIILDYCFKLFALICVMGGAYRITGYCFDQGKRRLGSFWAMTGVFFSVVSLPGASLTELVFFLGTALWMFACVWLQLRPGKDPVPPPPEPEEDAEAADESAENAGEAQEP